MKESCYPSLLFQYSPHRRDDYKYPQRGKDSRPFTALPRESYHVVVGIIVVIAIGVHKQQAEEVMGSRVWDLQWSSQRNPPLQTVLLPYTPKFKIRICHVAGCMKKFVYANSQTVQIFLSSSLPSQNPPSLTRTLEESSFVDSRSERRLLSQPIGVNHGKHFQYLIPIIR